MNPDGDGRNYMNILITSAETRLSQELAASLGATHRVRLTATSNVESRLPQNAEFVLKAKLVIDLRFSYSNGVYEWLH